MRSTPGWNHTDHITALNTAPERLTLYSRTLVRPTWLASIQLASRSVDSRAVLKRIDRMAAAQDARSYSILASRDPDSGISDGVARRPVRRAEDDLERCSAPAKRTGGVARTTLN